MLANTKHKFTVDEYLSLCANSVATPMPRVELIHGEVVDLSPLGHQHAKTQQRIQNALQQAFNCDDVYVTGSILADENNMPEPDVYVLQPNTVIVENYPNASQVMLVVEVSDTTLRYDLVNNGKGKLGVYAVGGIGQVWVVDVKKRVIHVFSSPAKNIYQNCTLHTDVIEVQGIEVDVRALICC